MIKGNISFRNSSKKSGLSFEKQSIEWDKMISSLKSNPKQVMSLIKIQQSHGESIFTDEKVLKKIQHKSMLKSLTSLGVSINVNDST